MVFVTEEQHGTRWIALLSHTMARDAVRYAQQHYRRWHCATRVVYNGKVIWEAETR